MVLLSHFSRIDRKYQTIAILVNNAFKTVQQSAKDKEDICRRADAGFQLLFTPFTVTDVTL